ncbi:MAG: glycosyltransferase family 39 protein [Candidatus Daviesbacteria bacterium]|nr:glycosyltransferase family 39 protein [Candidatus Daviesbacteria bacterium]
MKLKIKILFFCIIFLALILRIYKIDQIPPSISWDEAAVGYNAYTIANWGKDEWGKTFPLIFTSFEDDKHPVHIYFTALSVKILGLSDFSMRLPAAVFGILNVIVIFYLARLIFSSSFVGLISALFLAVSPYSIQFSRFNHEANFALFFWMFGLFLFISGVKGKRRLLPFAFLSFGTSLFAYHASKVVVPPLLIILIAFYWSELFKAGRYFLISLIIIGVFGLVMMLNPRLLGVARVNQTSFGSDVVHKTLLYQRTNNEILGRLEVTFNQYLLHLDPGYLFFTGGANKKFSTQVVGEFYKIDAPLLVFGFLGLLWGIAFKTGRRKIFLILLGWIILAPIPASLVSEAPHPARALFMMGSWNMIAAYGFYVISRASTKLPYKIIVSVIILSVLSILFFNYLTDYYNNYAKRDSIDWQYGMKQIVEYTKENDSYRQIFVTDIRFQPYIFFLYYLKTPLPEFLNTVAYNEGKSRGFSLVSFYNKYFFGDWDPVESMPNPGVLYAVTASQYDGLRYKSVFDVKKRIKYLDGGDAFFLVSYP